MTGSAQEISIEWTALTRSDEFILERHSGGDYSFTLDDLVISKFNSNATDSFGGISATVSLTKSSVTNGSITAESSYAKNSKATVTATADTGYLFTAWTGANTGSTNPLTLTMDDNKTIGATFSKDTRDTDSDGFSNYDELVTYSTNPADDSSYPTRTLTASSTTCLL